MPRSMFAPVVVPWLKLPPLMLIVPEEPCPCHPIKDCPVCTLTVPEVTLTVP